MGSVQTYEANKKLVSELNDILSTGIVTDKEGNLLPFDKLLDALNNAEMARDLFRKQVVKYEENLKKKNEKKK
jgi:hypothetical protein